MPYTSRTAIETRYGTSFVDYYSNEQIDAGIAAGDAEIDAYVSAHYKVPLGAVPAVLANIAIDMAIYHATPPTGAGMTEQIEKRYENARNLLSKIAKGLVNLGIAEDTPVPTADDVIITAPDRRYNRGLGL
ncbi:MAG: DUF1320 domain-containing protein [Alphaproteobacteria bacterium]|nr:DUF1320 domain-containing protein [Alphaproteobacteria bacterium]